jgi:hypothetical protein
MGMLTSLYGATKAALISASKNSRRAVLACAILRLTTILDDLSEALVVSDWPGVHQQKA